MAPVMIAALFWKRSTKWGALASTLFVAATLIGFGAMQGSPTSPAVKPAIAAQTNAPALVASVPLVPLAEAATNRTEGTNAPAMAAAGKPKNVIWQIGKGKDAIQVVSLAPNGDVRFLGFMTVVPMVFGSALCMILFSLLTRPPSDKTIEKYFLKA